MTRQIFTRLSSLLDYPDEHLADHARECRRLLAPHLPRAGDQMGKFLEALDSTPQGRMEEIYTATFDVNPTCYIFAGYILLGESFKRGEFLVRLGEKYRQHNFSAGKELADHIPVIFEFLGTLDQDEALRYELNRDCLLPALEKMTAEFKPDAQRVNPFLYVLRAGVEVLKYDLESCPPGQRVERVLTEREIAT